MSRNKQENQDSKKAVPDEVVQYLLLMLPKGIGSTVSFFGPIDSLFLLQTLYQHQDPALVDHGALYIFKHQNHILKK